MSGLETESPCALVLGASGLLGQSLCAALKARGWRLRGLDRSQGEDPLQADVVSAALEESAADVIFNTVAWTQVDAAEDSPGEALAVNRGLPALLAGLVRGKKVHLVHFSTDFVFNGRKDSPYTEEDGTDPLCVYGQSKLEGERVLLEGGVPNICVARTAWLFGPGRRNFVSAILEKAKAGGELTVVDDQTGSPTYAPDLAEAAINLAERRASGLVHVVNGGRASWCELAAEAVRQANLPAVVRPIGSSQWPQKARRPSWSVLSTERYVSLTGQKMRTWPLALREYVFGTFLAGQDV